MICRKRTGKNGVNGKITVDSGAYNNPQASTPRGKRRAACKKQLGLNRRPTPQEIRDFKQE